jgi:hypothetical protein
MKKLACLLLGAMALLWTASASAQVLNPSRFDDYTHLVHAGFGADAALGAEAGYVRSLTSLVGKPLVVGTRLTLPFAVEGGDFETAVFSQTGFILPSGLGVSPRVELAVRNAHTVYFNTTDAGIHLDALAGYFGERVLTAAEIAWEKPFSAYTNPTDRYRQEVYPDARSGLYSGGDGILRFGVALGVRVFTGSDLTMRGGIVRSEQLLVVDTLPFYAQLGFNQTF